MERDEIIIRNAVMHILNSNNCQLEFSDTLLELSPDINDFLRNHIYRIMDSDDTKKCTFTDDSEVLQLVEAFQEETLLMDSQMLAYKLYEIMNQNIDIPAADLFVVTFQVAGSIYLAILKMNYKETYIHRIEKYGTEVRNTVTKQKAALPSISAKLTEAAVINMNTLEIGLIEKKYDINGIKVNYFSNIFLQCIPQLSNKTKLNIVNKAVDQINAKYYEDDFRKAMEYKSLVYESNLDSGYINTDEIAEELFQEPEIRQEFTEKLKKYNLNSTPIQAKKAATVKKFERQQLITDQGIEIIIPMEEYNSRPNVFITNNPDGTQEITIKNISCISAR
ncbi:nucleoid-associated protein [Anaerocolumna chitinilytica]|uniref:Nucleoid-associated protein n=1 Tax=Anaerocolumna chitinilytica TaxID=1727145 RepID=A0A7M3SA12_9FIRM|nr:nucleoid-associated protein [Anaerocolumna chitinilytica]BCK01430.1 hypothetical protein bsdcttw_44700 [Anaerocolumna chitinilytica]